MAAGAWDFGRRCKVQRPDVAGPAHSAGARVVTSTGLAAILFVTLTAAIWQPDLRLPAHSGAAHGPLAAAPAAVTIIDATPRGKACNEQTWPYIERQCLNYGPAEAAVEPKPVEAVPLATAGSAPANMPDTRKALAPQSAPAEQPRPASDAQRAAPSTDDVSVADEVDEYQPSDEELRAMARAEERQRRRMRQRDFFRQGHIYFGPFRF